MTINFKFPIFLFLGMPLALSAAFGDSSSSSSCDQAPSLSSCQSLNIAGQLPEKLKLACERTKEASSSGQKASGDLCNAVRHSQDENGQITGQAISSQAHSSATLVVNDLQKANKSSEELKKEIESSRSEALRKATEIKNYYAGQITDADSLQFYQWAQDCEKQLQPWDQKSSEISKELQKVSQSAQQAVQRASSKDVCAPPAQPNKQKPRAQPPGDRRPPSYQPRPRPQSPGQDRPAPGQGTHRAPQAPGQSRPGQTQGQQGQGSGDGRLQQ